MKYEDITGRAVDLPLVNGAYRFDVDVFAKDFEECSRMFIGGTVAVRSELTENYKVFKDRFLFGPYPCRFVFKWDKRDDARMAVLSFDGLSSHVLRVDILRDGVLVRTYANLRELFLSLFMLLIAFWWVVLPAFGALVFLWVFVERKEDR